MGLTKSKFKLEGVNKVRMLFRLYTRAQAWAPLPVMSLQTKSGEAKLFPANMNRRNQDPGNEHCGLQ